MPLRLALFSFAVLAVGVFPSLPSLFWLWGLLAAIVPLIFVLRRVIPVPILCNFAAVVLGMAWGIYSGHQLVSIQLDESLAGKDLYLEGIITGLPIQQDRRIKFALEVRTATLGQREHLEFPQRVQLSWYPAYTQRQPLPDLKVGQVWQLKVRLKRPRGFVNPAGFDYQAWLLRQGLGATGYVVHSRANQLIVEQPGTGGWRYWIDRQRQQLQAWILSRSHSSERGILIALLIGDSALVEKDQWERMQQSGTSHLIAISGLHVGFLALFGYYLGLALGKCLQLVWRAWPAQVIAWVMAIACASFYSALAGFNIPTVRTLIMLSAFYLACLWRRNPGIASIYTWALALVVVIDPLAAYDLGFWLSFGAVALLLFYFSGRWVAKPDTGAWRGFSPGELLAGFIRSQWVMFVGLLIPLSVLVSNVSLVAPLANGIAIPLITFVVVPLLLVGAALSNWFPRFSDVLLSSAGQAMEYLKVILQALLDGAGEAASLVVAFSPAVALLVALGCLVLLLPRGLVNRLVGWAGVTTGAVLAFVVTPLGRPELQVSILDVGQGTAVVVQADGKTLVYDTGPRYTHSFDAGGAIVVPFLFAQGITRLDALVVSHNDGDHAGGLEGLLAKIPADRVFAGDPAPLKKTAALLPPGSGLEEVIDCHSQGSWRWGEVEFEFLLVPARLRRVSNNRSCVLLLRYRDQTVLLPGDIESLVENRLVTEGAIPAGISLLVAAHHGSRTSSGPRLVNHARPAYVVYSAGYRSQHGHPHPQVRQRFQAVNSREFATPESGALVFSWFADEGAQQAPQVTRYRELKHRYWFE